MLSPIVAARHGWAGQVSKTQDSLREKCKIKIARVCSSRGRFSLYKLSSDRSDTIVYRCGATLAHCSPPNALSAAMGRVSGLLRKLEVAPNDDEYESIATSRWGNRDVYPVAHDKRTYGIYAYVSYWGAYTFTRLPILEVMIGFDRCDRHVWNMSLLMDDWQFVDRHRAHGCAGHDCSYHWDVDCVCDGVSEWHAGC